MFNDLLKVLFPGANIDDTFVSIRDKVLDMRVADVLMLLSMLRTNQKGDSANTDGEEPENYIAQN